NGRAVIAAAVEVREQLVDLAAGELQAAPPDLGLGEGLVRGEGSPERSVSITDLAGSGKPLLGKGSEPPPPAPTVDAGGCVGRLGNESFLAPQLFTHAVRVRVDRDTGVVRVLQVVAAHDSGTILNKPGADGQ